MRFLVFVFIVSLTLSNCGKGKTSVCDCCEETYREIKDALYCIHENNISGTTSDNRLLLFAVVNRDIEKYQELEWNILNDEDVISTAKKNYLLIILDVNEIPQIKENNNAEFLQTIDRHKNESLFFIITNQALYPFGDWRSNEEKSIIIDRMQIGNGP